MNKPTDAEIDVMVSAYLGDCGPQATRVYSFAHAVLAKWGTPQPTQAQAGAVPLIRQLVAALEGYRRNHGDTQPCDAERAGRAWLEGKP